MANKNKAKVKLDSAQSRFQELLSKSSSEAEALHDTLYKLRNEYLDINGDEQDRIEQLLFKSQRRAENIQAALHETGYRCWLGK